MSPHEAEGNVERLPETWPSDEGLDALSTAWELPGWVHPKDGLALPADVTRVVEKYRGEKLLAFLLAK